MRPPLAQTMMLAILISVAPSLVRCQGESARQAAPGSVLEVIDVPAPSLAGGSLHMPAAERTAIYLPPSYGIDANKRYPVVYYLTGFTDPIFLYTHVPYYQGFLLQQAMDGLIGEGRIEEMIVVIPNGLTPLGGSFYVNSPVNGNWEDFIVRDLVGCIDAGFRTIAEPRARAISGHSMGGFGALNLAMHHPEVFAAVYAISPGLAAPGGLQTHPSFADSTVRQRVRDLLDTVGAMENCRGEAVLLAEASYWNQTFDTHPLFALAYGAAFAPGGEGCVLGLQYPFRRHGLDFVSEPAAWAGFEQGFGGWDEKIRHHLGGLDQLSLIAIDVGENDEYPWIMEGCRDVSRLMSDAGLRNELLTHSGGHEDRLRERLETSMFPALSRVFADGE